MATYEYNAQTKSGIYLQLTATQSQTISDTFSNSNLDVKIPLSEDSFSEPTDSQEYFFPIKDLFENISKTISSLKPSLLTTGADLLLKIQDIFGVRMFQTSLHRQAWRSPNPSKISVKLDFNFGLKDEFNAKSEVITPLIEIKKRTLPTYSSGAGVKNMDAPGPNALTVYTVFANDIISSTISTIGAAAAKAAEGIFGEMAGDAVESTASKISSGLGTSLSNFLTTAAGIAGTTWGRLWFVRLISYQAPVTSERGTSPAVERIIFESPPLVCKSSNVTHSNQIDDTGFPIAGSISLDFESQVPTTGLNYPSK